MCELSVSVDRSTVFLWGIKLHIITVWFQKCQHPKELVSIDTKAVKSNILLTFDIVHCSRTLCSWKVAVSWDWGNGIIWKLPHSCVVVWLKSYFGWSRLTINRYEVYWSIQDVPIFSGTNRRTSNTIFYRWHLLVPRIVTWFIRGKIICHRFFSISRCRFKGERSFIFPWIGWMFVFLFLRVVWA